MSVPPGARLEVGKAGSHGVPRRTLPVLAGDVVVATLRSSGWRESATACVGDREWVFSRQGMRALFARWSSEPADAVRLRAVQRSTWRGEWAIEMEGTAVERVPLSRWTGTSRYLADGVPLAEGGAVGWGQQRPTLVAADVMPLDHQVFLLWLDLVVRRRYAAAAAS